MTNTSGGSSVDTVSIVIPAFNESRRIASSLQRIVEYADHHLREYEIIVVDDGSSDGTADVVTTALSGSKNLVVIKNPQNRGKGYSVRVGALKARFPYVLLSDADLSTPIEEFEKLAAHASPTTLVIASRGMEDSKLEVRQPWYREMMGRIFNRIVQTLLLPGISDTQCGFKLFGHEVVRSVFPRLEIERWAFDVELIARAIKSGFVVREVPVRWQNDERSRVNPITDASRMFLDVLRVRWKLFWER